MFLKPNNFFQFELELTNLSCISEKPPGTVLKSNCFNFFSITRSLFSYNFGNKIPLFFLRIEKLFWYKSKLERWIESKLKRIPMTLDNFQPNSPLCQRISSKIFIRRNQSGQNLPITQALGRCSTIQRNYLYCSRFWSYKHINLGNY